MHSRLGFPDEHACAVKDCLRAFENSSKLQQHASKTGHKAFQCRCSKAYTKLCSLTRHVKEAVEKPQYNCPVCEALNYRCYSALVRISHLETHLRKIHKKTPAEVKAIVRPLRKRKPAVTSPSDNTSNAPADSTITPVTCDQTGATLSGLAALGTSVDGNHVEQIGLAVTTTSILPVNPAAYEFPSSGSFVASPTTGLPLSADAPLVNLVGWPSATGYVDAMAPGFPAGPVDGLTGIRNVFGLHTTSTQPASSYGYGQTIFGEMSAQQSDFSGHSAGVLPGSTLQHPAAPSGAIAGLRPLLPAPSSGYGQSGHGGMYAQPGMSSAATAFYPGNQADYYAVPGATFATIQPILQAPSPLGYGQIAHGGMYAQQNAFPVLAGGYNMAANPAGYLAAAPNNLGVNAAGFPTNGVCVFGQGLAAMSSAAAGGEAAFDLVGDYITDDFNGFDGMFSNNNGF